MVIATKEHKDFCSWLFVILSWPVQLQRPSKSRKAVKSVAFCRKTSDFDTHAEGTVTPLAMCLLQIT